LCRRRPIEPERARPRMHVRPLQVYHFASASLQDTEMKLEDCRGRLVSKMCQESITVLHRRMLPRMGFVTRRKPHVIGDAAAVKDYYERNTQGFLRFGQGASTGTIHRAVWGPGVNDRSAAFRYAHGRLAALVPSKDDARVVDLGCGVGASLVDIAHARQFEGVGVTLSPTQVGLARRRIAEAGLSSRLKCIEADYTALPPQFEPVDLAYGIESFVHGADPDAFFGEAARVIRAGGQLALCDDFLTPQGESTRRSIDLRWLEEFRRGWRIGTLLTVASANARASDHGFELVADEDWTPWLELERPRDRVIAAAVSLGRRLPVSHPWWSNLMGGNALQKGLLDGLLNYRFVVWRRS
jgi:cyclopropane fatty-acyl-phospholipid synthase-like methyltransferase